MMKVTQEESRLQLLGQAKAIAGGLGMARKKSSPIEDVKLAWRKGGWRQGIPATLLVIAVFGAGGVFFISLLAAVAASLAILRAYVLTQLWQWFIVPFGVMSLGLAHALGISILFGFMTRIMFHDLPDRDELKRHETRLLSSFGKEPMKDEKAWKRTLGRLAIHYFGAVAALGMGYVVHTYM